jgi:hypothetical protein
MSVNNLPIKELLRLKLEVNLSHKEIAETLNLKVAIVRGVLHRFRQAKITWPLVLTTNQLEENLYPNRVYCGSSKPFFINKNWVVTSKIRSNVTQAVEDLLATFKKSEHSSKGKFHEKKYRSALTMLLANLWFVGQRKLDLIVSMDTSNKKESKIFNPEKISNKTIQTLIKFLEDIDFILLYRAAPIASLGVSSWCEPTERMKDFFREQEINIDTHPKAQGVILKDFKDDKGNAAVIEWKVTGSLKTRRDVSNKFDQIGKNLDKELKNINTFIDKSKIVIEGIKVPVHLYRIFNNNSFKRGGRFYVSKVHQHLPSKERKLITIDGERVVELDYSAMHLNIIYALQGKVPNEDRLDKDGLKYELYDIDKRYERDLWKSLILRLVNVKSKSSFCGQVTKSGNPSNKDKVNSRLQKRQDYRGGISDTPPDKQYSLLSEGFIEGVPDGLKGEDALNLIIARHPVLESILEKPDSGLELQYYDSLIMAKLLRKLMSKGIVALPVHDSVIVPCKYEEIVKEEMLLAYQSVFPDCTIGIKRS